MVISHDETRYWLPKQAKVTLPLAAVPPEPAVRKTATLADQEAWLFSTATSPLVEFPDGLARQ